MKNDPYVQRAANVLSAQIRRLKKELLLSRGAFSSESIHHARVASRRLRATIWFFKDILPRGQAKQWDNALRQLARELGSARDRDVQRETLESWAASGRGSRTFGVHAIAAQWAADSQKARSVLPRARREFIGTGTLVRMKQALAGVDTNAVCGKRHFPRRAGKKLARCLVRLEQRSVPADKTNLLHSLRAAFRKLRYTLEICRPLNPRRLDRLIEQAHGFQDVLGRMHDIDVLSERLAAGKASAVPAATRSCLQRRCAREHAKLYRKFEQMWKRWKKQKLSGLIPEL